MSSAPSPSSTRIAAPALPSVPGRAPFPLIATLAPVLMSVVLWLVTRSPFALMLAALGPGIAVASLVDSRIGARRRSRAEEARFGTELAEAQSEIAREHERERAALSRDAPSAARLLAGPEHVRWSTGPPVRVHLGLAARPSRVAIDGVASARGGDPASVRLRTLRAEAATLRHAPLLVPLGSAIGVTGAPPQTAAVARAILVQVLAGCSPARFRVRGGEDWLDAVPHPREPGDSGVVEVFDDATSIVIVTARDPAALSVEVEAMVQVTGSGAQLISVDGAGELHPAFLATEQALAWAEHATRISRRHAISAPNAQLPSAVVFDELPEGERTSGLGCTIGFDADGPVRLDLVTDGPHAIIGGTTGSGKSELLITWLVAMARTYSPAELTLLLVDFKGGASFGAVSALPHSVGLVTDLDVPSAERAVASLAAELRHRERVLAAASARSIEQVHDLPRLVIVVDEFAAMSTELPALHAQFADIAARGRSLGVHLVLSTQRPAGVVRDAVLANASLRVSLRVNNRADSVAVIDTADAFSERAVPAGRAWLACAGASPKPVQVAVTDPAHIAAVAERWAAAAPPRRPWLDPLPRILPHTGEPHEIGAIDLPQEQSQPVLHWRPAADGNLLALGGSGSGRSTLLHAIAHGTDAVLVNEAQALWDVLFEPPAAAVVLIDDLDLVIAGVALDYQQALTERLGAALRSSATHYAITAQRLSAPVQALSSLCDWRLLLRMPNRQEHVIAGGSAATFDPALPPGAAHWREHRVQIALPPSVAPVRAATSVPFAPDALTIAVSPRAAALAARLAAAGFDVTTDPRAASGIVVTDPDGWQADWAAFTALAKRHSVLFHDCSLAEFRQLSRQRTMPPLITDTRSTAWLLAPTGEVSRVTL